MLAQIDLELSLTKRSYSEQIGELQTRLYALEQALVDARLPVVISFEGWAGTAKARTIGVMVRQLDPRALRVHSISPARTFESAYPWLYRFWLKLPSYGQIAIFDRSWYREMLAAYTTTAGDNQVWRQQCEDAVTFERQLADDGAIILKFWLHLSPEEQLRRFQERQNVPFKSWKLTDEDWRNREKWPQYEEAVDEMLLRSSTPAAPWTIVEAEDKRFARIKVLRTVVQRFEAELGKVEL